MKVYAFSGLGADGRIFSQLNLDHEIVPIQWLEPEKNETLPEYALRLTDQIDTNEPFSLLGVSFGGMLVSEIIKTLDPVHVILISSAATRFELPWMAAVSRRLAIHEVLPARIYKPPTWVAYIGFPTDQSQRQVAKGIIRDTDYRFVKWALGAIVHWDNEQIPQNVCHFHGRLDPILPLKRRMNAQVIGTGHFIILRHAEEISKRINRLFEHSSTIA